MTFRRLRGTRSKGQSLAEFALILVVLLLVIFIVLEASRVIWGWVTVQSAARSGARYAITGNGNCVNPPDRLTCIISTTQKIMDTLPLVADPQAPWGSDNAYRIEVWGVDANGQGPYLNFPGAPGMPVIIRTYYWVPIITPLLRPIRSNIPVFGQVVMNNEAFNSLGGASAGSGLPPPVPPLPTVGPTPSPTPSPSPTASPTAGPSPTATHTATATSTPTAVPCQTQFDSLLVHGNSFANITGALATPPPSSIILYDLSVTTTPGVPQVIGTAVLDGPYNNHACDGFVAAAVSPPLVGNHVILVSNNTDGSWDTEVVIPGTPTPTPTETPTPSPTVIATPTSTPTPSPTPSDPYIRVNPVCGFGPMVQFTVEGYNWTDASSQISLFWIPSGGSPQLQTIIPVGHGPSFVRFWQLNNVGNGAHTIEARSGATKTTATYTYPIPNITPTPTVFANTPTPNPADLIISMPQMISTPPLVEYQPIDVRFTITNTGSVDINTQFFIDTYFDPPALAFFPEGIHIAASSGYRGATMLAGGASSVITITAPLGFTGGLTVTREVWGMVDSVQQIVESVETNNVGGPLYVPNVTPAASPTPSPTPGGSDTISGIVRAFIGRWLPQYRAQVWLVRVSDGAIIATTTTGSNGSYLFSGIPGDVYSIHSCIPLDNVYYVGSRAGISPPDPFADIFLIVDPAGCPY